MGPFGFLMFPYLASWSYPYRYRLPLVYPFQPWLRSAFLFPLAIPKEEELRILEAEAKQLEEELAEIKRRIEELKK